MSEEIRPEVKVPRQIEYSTEGKFGVGSLNYQPTRGWGEGLPNNCQASYVCIGGVFCSTCGGCGAATKTKM